MELKGKSALVIGAATGIGMMACKEMLKNGVQKILMADSNATLGEEWMKKMNTEFGKDRCMFMRCDFTNAKELEAVFKMANTSFNGLDILINNTGVMDDDRWEMEIQMNLNAMIRGTMLGMQTMGEDKGGRGGVIINMCSVLGLQSMAGCPVNVATNWGAVGFTRSMAMPFHFDRTGVRMLTMCCGITDNSMFCSAAVAKQVQGSWAMELQREMDTMPSQQPEKVAQGVTCMLQKGNNGDVWVTEDSQWYKVEVPDRMTMQTEKMMNM